MDIKIGRLIISKAHNNSLKIKFDSYVCISSLIISQYTKCKIYYYLYIPT